MSEDLYFVPPQRGIFIGISPQQFHSVVRKAQAYTDAQTALELGVQKGTVSSYVEKARKKLGFDITQELIWAFYGEYAPVLLNHDCDVTP